MTATDLQPKICAQYGSVFTPTDPAEKLGIALQTMGLQPIYGVRVRPTDGVSGWYIWGGPHSTDPDFFQPIHAAHIPDLCPIVLKYLALAPGYKFIIDSSGYEDVWSEPIPEDQPR